MGKHVICKKWKQPSWNTVLLPKKSKAIRPRDRGIKVILAPQ